MKTKIATILISLGLFYPTAEIMASTSYAEQAVSDTKLTDVERARLILNYDENQYSQGYLSLILDYEGISEKMTEDQRNGRGQQWIHWLQGGVNKGYSLYWWLLARWHHNNNNKDAAYRALFTAWLITKVEGRTCSVTNSHNTAGNLSIADHFLAEHGDILQAGTTDNKVKQDSIIFASNLIKQNILYNKPLNGMSCNIIALRRMIEGDKKLEATWEKSNGLYAQRARPRRVYKRSLIDFRVNRSPEEQQRIARRQANELERLFNKMQGSQALQQTDVNTIFQTLNGRIKN